MSLIQTVNASDLYHMACSMGRGDQFGYKGWEALGEYLEQLSESIGEDIEVDIISICCDYTMCEDADEWWECYGNHSDIDSEQWEEMDDEEKLQVIGNHLNENTSVVCVEDGCIIWQAF